MALAVTASLLFGADAGTALAGGGLAGYVYGRGAAASGAYRGSALAGLLAGAIAVALSFGWKVTRLDFGNEPGQINEVGQGWLIVIGTATGAFTLLCTTVGGLIGLAIFRMVRRSRTVAGAQ